MIVRGVMFICSLIYAVMLGSAILGWHPNTQIVTISAFSGAMLGCLIISREKP